jgi:hypothetical protein
VGQVCGCHKTNLSSRNMQRKTLIRAQISELTITASPLWYHSLARGWHPLWIFLRLGGNDSLNWWLVCNLHISYLCLFIWISNSFGKSKCICFVLQKHLFLGNMNNYCVLNSVEVCLLFPRVFGNHYLIVDEIIMGKLVSME